jgi:hypothetical protein
LLNARNFVRGAAAGVLSKEAAEKTFDLYYDDGGIPRQFVQLYFDKYVKFDPSTTRHFFARSIPNGCHPPIGGCSATGTGA